MPAKPTARRKSSGPPARRTDSQRAVAGGTNSRHAFSSLAGGCRKRPKNALDNLSGRDSIPGAEDYSTPGHKTAASGRRPGPAKGAQPSAPARAQAVVAPQKPALPFPIVGIGASAGGLKAFETFLEHLPADPGLALVIIIHLDPHRESLLAELLSHRTRMSVRQAQDNEVPEPGRVYVIPPNRILILNRGRLRVSEAPDPRDLHRPIDIFLMSLAAEQKERAIGVILSGSGTDGTLGLRRIKAAGGLAMVQDASSSEFAGMPLSAMASGLADYILPVKDLPAALLQYVRSPYYIHSGPEAGLQPESALQRILGLLRTKAGRDFRNYKAGTLLRRIRRRMILVQAESLEAYARLLEANPDEIHKLFKDLLIGVTEFFRDPEAWKDLQKFVLPDLIRRLEPGRPLRAWVPGCASGREAYTLAILCLEQFDAQQRPAHLQIFATDIDDQSLDAARAGLYDPDAAATVPPGRLTRFFTQVPGGFRVKPELRDVMVFTSHNLLSDPPFSHLDLIICRNLLIYLEAAIQKQITQMFHSSLKDKGCLFLGSSETAGQQGGAFRLLSKKSRLYQKIGHSRMLSPPALFFEPAGFKPDHAPAARFSALRPVSHYKSLAYFAQQALLEQFAPAAVLIDRYYRIHFYHGPTEKYLQQPQGEPTHDARLLAREGLAGRLRLAAKRCFETGQPARVATRVRREGRLYAVEMTLLPVALPRESEHFLLVSFTEPAVAQARPVPELDLGPEEKGANRLEQELRQTREELQISIEQLESTNEELEASNEEVMSINEELQSANEELESSKAELQSLNEELTTVNHQLQEKVSEVESANNDLSNLLASTRIPTLFLDTGLRIRRYTSATLSLFQLIPSDAGRPISDIRHQFATEDLVADAQAVLDHLRPVEREIRSVRGEWYLRRIHPYCVNERCYEGVVITYTDITDLKRAQEEIGHQASFPIFNPNPVLELDLSGNPVFCNQSALDAVQRLTLADARAFIPSDIGRSLAAAEQGRAETRRCEVAVSSRIFSETVQAVPQFKTVRIYALDVTDARRAEQALLESEQRFRSVLENSLDVIYRVNLRTGRFEYVSPASAIVLDLTPGELVGQSLRTIHEQHIHPDDLPAVEARMEGLIQAGGGRQEYRWLGKNREYRWLSSQVSVVKDEAGLPWYRDGILRDITRSKRVEADLREARDYLENLINYANAPIICWDSDFNITRFNHAFERMTGYEARAVIGQHLGLLFPEDSKQESLAKIQEALSGERWEGEEIPILRQDGSIRIALWNSANVYAVGGSFLATIAQGQDITERKQAEALARKRTEHLQLLSEASLDLQKAADPTALVKELFQKVRLYLDVQIYFNFMVNETNDTLVLDSYAGISDDTARSLARLDLGTAVCGTVALSRQSILATDIRYSDDEKVQLIKSFGIRAYFCNPLLAGDRLLGTLSFGSTTRDTFDKGEQEFMRTVCHYVAMAKERLRLVSMLREQNLQLIDAGQRKDQFLAMLSHELRNPLAPISTTLELLRRHPAAADGKIAHWLGIFSRQLRYLTRIIDDLLDASRVSRGLIAIQKQPVSLREAAGQALENNRELIEGRAQIFELNLPDADLILEADPVRLVQILSNLINNASKYTPAGGRISLAARPESGRAVIEITDTGIGIAASDLPHVFDAFFQADKSLDRPHSGLGLGLSLVGQMTALHGGEIAIDSQGENQGTRVSLSLPLSAASGPLAEPAGRPEAGQSSPARKLKILIADDNVDFAESLGEVLGGWGHEIFIKHNGPEALQAAPDLKPDIVLLDIGLPGADGYEVARRLRSLPDFAQTVLAALTGYGQPEDRKRAEEAGFNFHFTKPIDIARMERILQGLATR